MLVCLMAAILKFGLAVASGRQIASRGLRSTCQFTGMSQLDNVPDVDIDGHGRFKYILIDVQDDVGKTSKKIVRGYARAQWHSDIFDQVNEQIKKYAGLQANCVGGGRIEHDPDEKTIKVYGYSTGFGKADHQVSVELLKKKYPAYNITWSDDGY
ncbi:PREDICTED: 14 kDa phosphohistidine phosphatase-like isoform X1 [Wasmannia auropunctata]|uniref:14 kDa phosphohistidine phosphatase-like isoform X1 n=1 Tax=Wasmannia auropunctata TaxID=64793 RepID=UPI0005EE113A|nr:PREDICTED: 14 kDa phosphohistidine phosphatase-like isoform X1 [Wasmannia auropunctata]